jgi:hypothetical protein
LPLNMKSHFLEVMGNARLVGGFQQSRP